MLKGWIVYHGFNKTEKLKSHIDLFVATAKSLNVQLEARSTTSLLMLINQKNIPKVEVDFIIFYDKDVKLARWFELQNLKVINSATAIAACDDKVNTYLRLANQNIPLIPTISCPKRFYFIDWSEYQGYLAMAIKELGFPLVIKECYGSYGHQVYLIKDETALIKKLNELGSKEILLQKFIKTKDNSDFRVYVVNHQIISVIKRTNPNDFRANLTLGAKIENATLTIEQQQLVIKVSKLLALDYGGIDLIYDGHTTYLCEVNSNANFLNLRDFNQKNISCDIINHIKEVLHKCMDE